MTGRQAALFADAGLARRADGELCLDGVALQDIAGQIGTPTYVYAAGQIRARYRALDTALQGIPHTICYAVKANSNLSVLQVLGELGAGADIVSGGELERALVAGIPADRVVFSGVGKSRAELRQAVGAGVGQINVESVEELRLLVAVAADLENPVSVGIRVNPDVTAETHPYIATGKHGIKFGIPVDQALEAARLVAGSPYLTLTGIAVHLGSQLLRTKPYEEALERLLALLPLVQGACGGTVRALGLGGGIGIRYVGDEEVLSPEEFAAAIGPPVHQTGLELHLEPGRSLVGSAGVLLTEVLYRKHAGGRDFVIVDAGMNDLVRPSHYQAYHEIVPVASPRAQRFVADVVGPVCETGDFLALERELPLLEAGDCAAILGAGAYGFVMSSQYNSRCRAAEVLVDGGTWRLCRPRESAAEILAAERAALPRGVTAE